MDLPKISERWKHLGEFLLWRNIDLQAEAYADVLEANERASSANGKTSDLHSEVQGSTPCLSTKIEAFEALKEVLDKYKEGY